VRSTHDSAGWQAERAVSRHRNLILLVSEELRVHSGGPPASGLLLPEKRLLFQRRRDPARLQLHLRPQALLPSSGEPPFRSDFSCRSRSSGGPLLRRGAPVERPALVLFVLVTPRPSSSSSCAPDVGGQPFRRSRSNRRRATRIAELARAVETARRPSRRHRHVAARPSRPHRGRETSGSLPRVLDAFLRVGDRARAEEAARRSARRPPRTPR
jgi:hypothetical protein